MLSTLGRFYSCCFPVSTSSVAVTTHTTLHRSTLQRSFTVSRSRSASHSPSLSLCFFFVFSPFFHPHFVLSFPSISLDLTLLFISLCLPLPYYVLVPRSDVRLDIFSVHTQKTSTFSETQFSFLRHSLRSKFSAMSKFISTAKLIGECCEYFAPR